jgi:hypothetical protein
VSCSTIYCAPRIQNINIGMWKYKKQMAVS